MTAGGPAWLETAFGYDTGAMAETTRATVEIVALIGACAVRWSR